MDLGMKGYSPGITVNLDPISIFQLFNVDNLLLIVSIYTCTIPACINNK